MDGHAEQMYELMRNESNRLKTFQMNPPWPKDYVDIKKLAKAGFFYAFNGDNVYCAFCRGQVCRWDRDDDPMSEHARHFTTCPFIMGGEVGNEPLGEDPFPGPKRPRPYDVCGAFPNFPPNDPRTTPTMQPSNQQQRNHNHQSQQPHPQAANSNDEQINNYNQNERAATTPEPLPPPQITTNNQRNNNTSLLEHYFNQFNHHNQMNSSSGQSQQLAPPPPPSYEESFSLESDQNGYSSPVESSTSNTSNCSSSSNSLTGICKICYSNSIELTFLPCGHAISCIACAQRLHCCPYCRVTISSRIRSFYI